MIKSHVKSDAPINLFNLVLRRSIWPGIPLLENVLRATRKEKK